MRINKLAAAFTAVVLSVMPVMSAAAYGEKAVKPDPILEDFDPFDVNGAVSIFITEEMKAHIVITFDSNEGEGLPYYDYVTGYGGQYYFNMEGREDNEDDFRHYHVAVSFEDEYGTETPAYIDDITIPEGDGEKPVIYEYSFSVFDAGSKNIFTVTGLKYPENGKVYCHKDIALNMDTIIMGDVNFDGKITAIDASAVLVEYAEVTNGGGSFDELQNKVADVNHDGKITATDASSILRYYTALSSGAVPSWS